MGYGEAPWTFKGKALYQLQLVPSTEVEANGDRIGAVTII